LVVLAGLYGTTETAMRLGFPSHGFWEANRQATDFVLFAVATTLIFVSGIRLFVLEDRIDQLRSTIGDLQGRLEESQRHLEIQDGFQAVLTSISRSSNLPMHNLGVSAWRINGHELERVAFLRLHNRSRSGIVWTEGKGVIGRCWQESRELLMDLAPYRGARRGRRGRGRLRNLRGGEEGSSMAKVLAKDVYVVRRDAGRYQVTKESVDLLRNTGASEITIRSAEKMSRGSVVKKAS
jgi:hypothetical protein